MQAPFLICVHVRSYTASFWLKRVIAQCQGCSFSAVNSSCKLALCHRILIPGPQSGCRKILIHICYCLIFRLNRISTHSAPGEIKAPHLKTTILIGYHDGDLNISTVSTSLLRVNSSAYIRYTTTVYM